MATFTLNGNKCSTNDDLPDIGSTAPDFKLTDGALADKTLADFKGKKKLLDIVLSLDTGVCANSAKKFNEHAKAHADTVILIISADLPFAMGRVCTGEKLDNVVPLSMMRSKNFAKDYGVLIQDGPLAGITARSVIVLDANNKVLYTQLVPEASDEPDYAKALAALA